ncbi:methyltransferase [Kitasatospora sp. NPDC094028]
MRYGSRGHGVECVQVMLNRVGLGHTIAVDGQFGPDTKGMVEDFQRAHGRLYIDGIVGRETGPAPGGGSVATTVRDEAGREGSAGMAEEQDVVRAVRTEDELLELLDGLFARDREDREERAERHEGRSRPTAADPGQPDENLADLLERGVIRAPAGGRGLDLGCGNGRNTLHLGMHGFAMDGLDPSRQALERARSRQEQFEYHLGFDTGVRFHCGDAFGPAGAALTGPYDLVYDSGLFHHLPPHRRPGYLALVGRLLAPGGHLGLICAAPDGDGSGTRVPDAQLYRDGTLYGGLAYTADELRRIFVAGPPKLQEVELRRMRDESAPDARRFGRSGLWAALFRRPEE